MLRRNDMSEFGKWSRLIAKSLSTSMLLHGYCLGIRINDSSVRNDVFQNDKQYFQVIMKNITSFIRNGTRQIKSNHMTSAGREVKDYARNNENMGHQDFADNVERMLNQKYYYRLWLIVSYDGDTHGFEWHTVNRARYTFFWFRQHNRCVYLASTNNPEDMNPKLRRCISENKDNARWYEAAVNIWNDLDQCMRPYNGLAVISKDIGISSATHNSGAEIEVHTDKTRAWFFTSHAKDSVFAVAPELEHYTTTSKDNAFY